MIWITAYVVFILTTWGLWHHGWHTIALIYALAAVVAIIAETRRHIRSIREGNTR